MGYNVTVNGKTSGSQYYVSCSVVSSNLNIIGTEIVAFRASQSGGSVSSGINRTYSKNVDFPTLTISSSPDNDYPFNTWLLHIQSGNYPSITNWTVPVMSYYPYNHGITYVKDGKFVTYNFERNTNFELTFTIDYDFFNTGLSQLVTSGNIKAAVYNGTTYPPGATIPLDPSVENITLVNQNYTMTLNDTQNMKQVQIGDTIYKDFPVTQTLSENTVVNMSGKDDPVITVDYTNTGNPTVTNTKV